MSDVNIQSMIDGVQSNNNEAADNAFKNAIMSKITTALDVKRVELASTVYNNVNEYVENTQRLDENRMKKVVALKKSVITHLNDAQKKDYESVKDSPKEQVVFFKKIAASHTDKDVKADAKKIATIFLSMLGSAA